MKFQLVDGEILFYSELCQLVASDTEKVFAASLVPQQDDLTEIEDHSPPTLLQLLESPHLSFYLFYLIFVTMLTGNSSIFTSFVPFWHEIH